jgi:hypothetical protein
MVIHRKDVNKHSIKGAVANSRHMTLTLRARRALTEGAFMAGIDVVSHVFPHARPVHLFGSVKVSLLTTRVRLLVVKCCEVGGPELSWNVQLLLKA